MNYLLFLMPVGRDAGGGTTNFPFANKDAWITGLGLYADGRIERLGELSDHCFGPGRLTGDMEIFSTNLVLINEDGELDNFFNYSFDFEMPIFGADPETQEGLPSSTQQWGKVAHVWCEQPVFEKARVNFALRSARAGLDLPLMTTKYVGTNAGAPLAGIEGTANDLKGLPKPLVLGQVFNVTPKLVNSDRLIYQFDHQGFRTGYALTMYDKRAVLTAGADYVSQADMETNAPAVGQYRKWPAGGCVRLGSAPTGAVTGDLTNPPTASASSTILNVVNAIINTYAPAAYRYNDTNSALSANCLCGVYLDKEYTMLEAVNEVLRSVSGFLFFRGDGVHYITQITPPATPLYLSALDPLELDDTTIIENSMVQVIPGDGAYGLPVWRVNLNYKKNYTVMSASELAGAAAADIAFCEREYRTVKSEDATVQTQWPKAVELNVMTNLTDATEAQTECDRVLTLFKTRRQCFKLRVHGSVVKAHPQFNDGSAYQYLQFQIACRVNVTLDRFGLSAGKTFLVIGVDRDLVDDIYELTIWG